MIMPAVATVADASSPAIADTTTLAKLLRNMFCIGLPFFGKCILRSPALTAHAGGHLSCLCRLSLETLLITRHPYTDVVNVIVAPTSPAGTPMWPYFAIAAVFAPLLVMGIGYLVMGNRQRRRTRTTDKDPASTTRV